MPTPMLMNSITSSDNGIIRGIAYSPLSSDQAHKYKICEKSKGQWEYKDLGVVENSDLTACTSFDDGAAWCDVDGNNIIKHDSSGNTKYVCSLENNLNTVSPSVYDNSTGKLFFPLRNGAVKALDLANKKTNQLCSINGLSTMSAKDGDQLYGTADGKLYANESNGLLINIDYVDQVPLDSIPSFSRLLVFFAHVCKRCRLLRYRYCRYRLKLTLQYPEYLQQ